MTSQFIKELEDNIRSGNAKFYMPMTRIKYDVREETSIVSDFKKDIVVDLRAEFGAMVRIPDEEKDILIPTIKEDIIEKIADFVYKDIRDEIREIRFYLYNELGQEVSWDIINKFSNQLEKIYKLTRPS